MDVCRAKNPKCCSALKLCKYHPCARNRCKWYRIGLYVAVDFSNIEQYITGKAHLLIRPKDDGDLCGRLAKGDPDSI